MSMPWRTCGDQRTLWQESALCFTLWVLGLELRSSCSAATAFTPRAYVVVVFNHTVNRVQAEHTGFQASQSVFATSPSLISHLAFLYSPDVLKSLTCTGGGIVWRGAHACVYVEKDMYTGVWKGSCMEECICGACVWRCVCMCVHTCGSHR